MPVVDAELEKMIPLLQDVVVHPLELPYVRSLDAFRLPNATWPEVVPELEVIAEKSLFVTLKQKLGSPMDEDGVPRIMVLPLEVGHLRNRAELYLFWKAVSPESDPQAAACTGRQAA